MHKSISMDRSELVVADAQVVDFGQVLNKIIVILDECNRVINANHSLYKSCTDHQIEFQRQIMALLQELRPQFDRLSQHNWELGQQMDLLFSHVAGHQQQPPPPPHGDIVFYDPTYDAATTPMAAPASAVREAQALVLAAAAPQLAVAADITTPPEYTPYRSQQTAEAANAALAASSAQLKTPLCVHANDNGKSPGSAQCHHTCNACNPFQSFQNSTPTSSCVSAARRNTTASVSIGWSRPKK